MNNAQIKNLTEGQRITFKRTRNGTTEVFTRKIQSIYVCGFADRMHYNTRGRNGGFGCNGFQVSPDEILEVHKTTKK